MLLLQPKLLTVFLAVVTPIQSTLLLNGRDLESRANHDARERLAKPKSRARSGVMDLQNFQLPNVYTHTFSGVTGDDLNRTITFSWNDVNSNTSTICTTEWLDKSSSPNSTVAGATYPTSYIQCDNSNPSFENWQWYFSSMTSLGLFQLTLAHEYIDPSVGPFPYDSLQVFATYNANLTCTTASTGYEKCYLSTAQSPAAAEIYAFSA